MYDFKIECAILVWRIQLRYYGTPDYFQKRQCYVFV